MIFIKNEQDALSFNASNTQKQKGLISQADHFELYLENGEIVHIPSDLFKFIQVPEPYYNPILYGKNGLEGIVGAEVDGENLILFLQKGQDTITKVIPNRLWLTALKNHDKMFKQLEGDREFQWIRYYKDFDKWKEAKKLRYKLDIELYHSYCPVEANLITRGLTYFKGLQVKDVPVLSFDIETDGLEKTKNSDIYLISNTFRNGDQVEHKLFDFHDYETRKEMLEAWCSWVREKNPAIMLGHNIYGYDFPYLNHVANLNDVSLDLGRDKSAMTINSYPSKFRKDGTEAIEYFRCNIWGREVVDTYFLSFKYDVGRKYESNGLKQIIKQEGLEKTGRVFVEAGKIKNHINNPEMWEKIKDYASTDSEDALKLFDLMAPSFFYFNQMVPKKFEDLMNGASGSQLNSLLVRCYLQDGKSVPKASETRKIPGGISFGIPGIYRNLYKQDIRAMYPSIILQYNQYDPQKDPEAFFYKICDIMTKKRFEYKILAKQTGSQYYKDQDQAAKIIVNSMYGLMNTPGLNFNSPDIGEFITTKGQNILSKAIMEMTNIPVESWIAEFKRKTGKDIEEEE